MNQNLPSQPDRILLATLSTLALFSLLVPAGAAEVEKLFFPQIIEARLKGEDFVVTSPKDAGPGTLRQAILDAANAGATGTVITFSPRLNGKTIKLSSGELEIAENAPHLEISAADLSKGITIDAQQTNRIFNVRAGTYVHLENLTLTGGMTSEGADNNAGFGGSGGAIHSVGALQLTDCVLSQNATADSQVASGNGGFGGAISNNGNGILYLIRCVLSNNVAGNGTGTGFGGRGGAIHNRAPQLHFEDCTFDNNRSGNGENFGGYGGALYNAGIGIFSGTNSTFSRNVGGNGNTEGALGGAIYNGGSGFLSNCTIAKNCTGSPNANGGGIFNASGADNLTLIHCTVVENQAATQGGGVYNAGPGTVFTPENTIISNNTAPTDANLSGPEVSNSGVNFFADTPLAPLANYGGLTETVPPIPGETLYLIFDNADSRFLPVFDQRGTRRDPGRAQLPGRQGELGAVEVDCQLEPRLMIENGATVLTVKNTRDSGPGSLRQALLDADSAGPEGAVIVFSPKLKGKTIRLTSGALFFTNTTGKVVVAGASLAKGSTEPIDLAGGITISGNQQSRVIDIPSPNSKTLLRNLTITEGLENGTGGGIIGRGELTLCDCVVTGNATTDNPSGNSLVGGGIRFSGGSLLLQRSTISNNRTGDASNSSGSGGGILALGDLICVNSTISGNRTGNAGNIAGAGAGVFASGSITQFFQSTIDHNTVGSGGSSAGVGGGILVDLPTEMTNCTVTANTARFGGGIRAAGTCTLIHCTVAGNTATESGGGISFAQNAVLQNTIVSDNFAPGNPNLAGTPTDNGGNYTIDGADLAPLGDYGGPTRTMPPLVGSPVINSAVDGTQTDQRGGYRPGFGFNDIGAVEQDFNVLTQLTRATDPPTPFPPAETDVNAIDPDAAGTFSGLLTDPVSGVAVGTIKVKMTSSGAISVSISNSLLGVRTGFRTTLDALGKTNGILTVNGVQYNLFLELVRTSGGENKFKFDGEFGRVGDTTYDASLDRHGYHPGNNPAPMAGRYTTLLPATLDPETPQGDGYGIVTVGTNGKVKFAGALGDGTKFTTAGFVSEDREWRLFKDLYRTKPKGNLGGVVTFEDIPFISDFNGTLSWIKLADTREKLYSDGFFVEQQKIIGSLYSTPFPNEALIDTIVTSEPNNATWEMGKGNVEDPGRKTLNWDGKNRVTANGLGAGQVLKITPATGTGLVKGVYVDKSMGLKVPFAGVAFQKQSVISGHFRGDGESGFFAIRPNGGGAIGLFSATGQIINGLQTSIASIGIAGGRAEYEFEVRNLGNGNLSTEQIFVDSSTPSIFSVINGAPKILSPGESLFLRVRVDPFALGRVDGDVKVVSDAGTVQIRIRIDGVNGGSDATNDPRDEWTGNIPSIRPGEFQTLNGGNFNPLVHAGTFEGFARPTITDPSSVAGFVKVKISGTGAVSGNFTGVDGVKETFKGNIAGLNILNTTTNRESPVSILLSTVFGGSGGIKLGGGIQKEFRGVVQNLNFGLVCNGFHKTQNPNDAFDGRFTMVLPSGEQRGDDAPKGDGYGSVTIGSNGKTKALLILGDGTKATHSGFVSVDGEWLLFQNLYRTKPKGYLAGRLLFRDLPGVSDFDGELQWVKHADPREKRFNRGFEFRQLTLGSEYTPSLPGQRAFDAANPLGDLNATFSEGDLFGVPAMLPVNWQPDNRVIYQSLAGERLVIKVNPKTGLISGAYIDPARKLKAPLGAVIFEKQNIATGLFHADETTGVFSME